MPNVIRRPMTEEERRAALALTGCTFTPASYNKRFARDLSSVARSNNPQITNRQAWNLWRLVCRYRRQIKDTGLVELAAEQSKHEPETPSTAPCSGRVVYREDGRRRKEFERLKTWNEANQR